MGAGPTDSRWPVAPLAAPAAGPPPAGPRSRDAGAHRHPGKAQSVRRVTRQLRPPAGYGSSGCIGATGRPQPAAQCGDRTAEVPGVAAPSAALPPRRPAAGGRPESWRRARRRRSCEGARRAIMRSLHHKHKLDGAAVVRLQLCPPIVHFLGGAAANWEHHRHRGRLLRPRLQRWRAGNRAWGQGTVRRTPALSVAATSRGSLRRLSAAMRLRAAQSHATARPLNRKQP